MESSFSVSRLGQFTASPIYDLLGYGKNKEPFTQTGYTYINEKIAECITGESKPSVRSISTDWGNEHEKDAVMWFERITGKKVQHFGVENYKYIPYNDYSGCSPDGLVIGEQATIQVKCPYLASNYVPYLIGERTGEWLKKHEPKYYAQCQFEMMCAKVELCYFTPYHPLIVDERHRMVIIELRKDAEMWELIDTKITLAAGIVREALAKLSTFDTIPIHEEINGNKVTVIGKI